MTIQQNIKPFFNLLASINIDEVEMPIYTKKYFINLLKHNTYSIEVFANVLENALTHSKLNICEIRLLDFGAGNGLLSFFAKYCGVPYVTVCDVKPMFIDSIKALSKALTISIDDFIVGDESNVSQHFAKRPNKPNLCIGTDVIEHVYSVDALIKAMYKVNPSMHLVFTTASVHDNYFKRKQLYKLMLKDEYLGYDTLGDDEEGNPHAGEAFLSVRQKIITKKFPELTDNQIQQLAKVTRGFNENAIESTVNLFINTSLMPAPPTHKYNTCNPITSSFTEQMITKKQYVKHFNRHDFAMVTISGLHNCNGSYIKKTLLKLANVWIKTFKTNYLGRLLTPYVILIGIPKKIK